MHAPPRGTLATAYPSSPVSETASQAVPESHGRLPSILAALLLLLAASSSPFVSAGGGIGALAGLILPRARGRVSVSMPWIVAGGVVGGVVAALVQGTEIRPPAGAGAAVVAMLRHVVLAGVAFGGVLAGGGVALLARSLVPGAGGGPVEPAGPGPRLAKVRAIAGAALRPFRLVALLFVLAYAPILASQLRSGATEARIEMVEELRRIGYHQEAHHRTHGRFADDLRALRQYVPIMEGRVEIASAGPREWSAAVRHRRLTTVCTTGGSVSAEGMPLEPMPAACAETRRWFPGDDAGAVAGTERGGIGDPAGRERRAARVVAGVGEGGR